MMPIDFEKLKTLQEKLLKSHGKLVDGLLEEADALGIPKGGVLFFFGLTMGGLLGTMAIQAAVENKSDMKDVTPEDMVYCSLLSAAYFRMMKVEEETNSIQHCMNEANEGFKKIYGRDYVMRGKKISEWNEMANRPRPEWTKRRWLLNDEPAPQEGQSKVSKLN